MAVLKNIVSKIFNLGTTPSKKTEGQFWYDTTNNILKRSDGADYKPLPVGDNLISAGSTDTVKGILDSKANNSDLSNYILKTGGTIQNPSLEEYYDQQTITTLNGDYIEIANRSLEPVWTKITQSSIEINYPDSHASTVINEQSFSTSSNNGSTSISGPTNLIVDVATSVCQVNGKIPDVDNDGIMFFGQNIGLLNFETSTIDDSIFKVGYIQDYNTNEHTPEISGSLVDKSISSSSLDTHIPTSKAVFDAVNNKQDKLSLIEEDTSEGELYLGDTEDSAYSWIRINSNSQEIELYSLNTIIGFGEYSGSSLIINSSNISGSAIASTLGTSTTSTKLPTEGAVVKAISDVKTSLGSALTYEGSVENYSNLPTGLTTSDKGKVYNVVNANGNIPAGTNYAWNGTSWDALGGDYTALKDYVDDCLDDKITKNTDAELNAFIMPTYNSSGVQNGKAKIMLYKDDTTGAITIEAEEIVE